MALIGQYQQTTFANPQNGQAPDADVIRANDNAVTAKHNAHDADATIHTQTGLLSARPAAGTAGAVYIDENKRIYVDNGTAWGEVPYARLDAAGTNVFVNNVEVGGALNVGGTTSLGTVNAGAVTATSFTGTHNGSAAGLTGIPAANITGTLPAISGANLTSLNGSNISSGTVAAARLPDTYTSLTVTTQTSDVVQGVTAGNRAILNLAGSQSTFLAMSSGCSFLTASAPAGGINQYLNVRIGTTDYRITLVPV